MSSGYSILKKKNGDLILFGGDDEKKPNTIDIEKEEILSFITSLAEYLDHDDLSSLETIIDDRLGELEIGHDQE